MKINKDLLKNVHHPLVTRRDFLAQGLIAFSAVAALPTVMGLNRAMAAAANCGAGTATSGMTPFMVFDMAGGSAMPGNFLVGKQGGPQDLLASYSRLGWDPRASGALNTDFGLPMSANFSKILAGILANSSAEARANFRMGSFCHFSQDDTSGNKLSAGRLALMAGQRGTYISNGLSIMPSLSGGNSAAVMESAALKPTFVKSINDVLGATNFGGSGLDGLDLGKKTALAQGAFDLSTVQKTGFADQPFGKDLAGLSDCAYGKSLEFLTGVQGLDPRQDRIAQAVYQLNAQSDVTSGNAIAASLAMNTIKGFGGPSVWTLGGCDYHVGSQQPGDDKDMEMGVQIGRAVEFAYRSKKPFFFQLLTDGGISASEGTRNWSSDSGDKGMTVIGYYEPTAAPKMIRQQIGNYTDGQGAEQKNLIGADPQLVAHAVFANYLNICGKLSTFHDYAPGVFTGPGQLDSVLIFEGKAS